MICHQEHQRTVSYVTSRANIGALNHGSAENRLHHHAAENDLVDVDRLDRMQAKITETQKWIDWMESHRPGGKQGTFADHIRRSANGKERAPDAPEDYLALPGETRQEIEYRVTYRGYLEREQRQVEKLKHIEKVRIPADLDYLKIRGLRNESAQKLADTAPSNLGQASRISGVNPADISILLIFIESRRRLNKED